MNDVFTDLAADRIARFRDEHLTDPGRPVSGAACCKVFRHFKTYDDPALNPQLRPKGRA